MSTHTPSPLPRIAILDFETTGEPASRGGRATEIAIILFEGSKPISRFQSLMNAGAPINSFASELTGITDEMIADAPSAAHVMRQAADFVGDAALVAHNASFDTQFWDAELARIGRRRPPHQHFACTMLLSRRLFPDAPNHKLGTLADRLRLPKSGKAHRAMADTEMAAGLWIRLNERMFKNYGVRHPPHALMLAAQQAPAKSMDKAIAQWIQSHAIKQDTPP